MFECIPYVLIPLRVDHISCILQHILRQNTVDSNEDNLHGFLINNNSQNVCLKLIYCKISDYASTIVKAQGKGKLHIC